MERIYDVSKLKVDHLPGFFNHHEWGIIIHPMGTAHLEMIAQFYANFHDADTINYTFKTLVKNEPLLVDRNFIAILLNLNRIGTVQVPQPENLRPTQNDLANHLLIKTAGR